VVYFLTAGSHVLTIKQREDGTKIDKILITDDMQYTPQGQGEVQLSAPVIISSPVTTAAVNQPYTYDVNATGNPAPTYSLVGTVPAGMTINASTGVIQWTPTTAGVYTVSAEALNSLGTDTQNFTITVSESDTVKIWLEAEGGVLHAPMAAASNAQASSGQYIWIPNGQGNISDASQPGGYAEYSFQVSKAGNYIVWGRVISNSDGDDSFFVSMDYGVYSLWDTQMGGTETWVWDLVNNRGGADPVVYFLTAGSHVLTIKQREDGTKIDKILITDDMQYTPQGQGE
jgi:hypothetical protein